MRGDNLEESANFTFHDLVKIYCQGKLSLALSLSDQTASEPNRQQSHSILNQNYRSVPLRPNVETELFQIQQSLRNRFKSQSRYLC